VDLHNAAAFIQAGCAALGVGSSLVSTRLLKEANWAELTQLAREFVAAVQQARTNPPTKS
jgi:2-dehydro-3-deoxyphosphogluconate aldolase/(4S)-4-hydroxy-2-oxoglutarate aldolase